MANPFVHVELHTSDPDAAKKFYSGLFSWKLEDMPMGDFNYTMVQVGEGTGGGIMKNPAPGAPSHWLSYIQVDDLEGSTKQAEKLGGKVVQAHHGSSGHGLFQHHLRSGRSRLRALGAEVQMK